MFSFKQSPSTTTPLIFLPLTLLALTILFLIAVYHHDFQLGPVLFAACRAPPPASPTPLPPAADLRLLFGIFTHPDRSDRRHLLRMIYSLQAAGISLPARARVDVRFVLCGLTTEEQRILIALEIMRFGDIIILDCVENMDDGKTYTYFSSLPELFNGTDGGREGAYDFAMKADDDAYFRLPRLVESLGDKPRRDAYFGLQEPCQEDFFPFPPYMEGMGYAVSWDLVEWIAASEIARNDVKGPEDMLVGKWFNVANKAKNRLDALPAMYDYKGPLDPANCLQHEFVPDTIAVHKLKDKSRWVKTLKYFKATEGLKPSKLYHIP